MEGKEEETNLDQFNHEPSKEPIQELPHQLPPQPHLNLIASLLLPSRFPLVH